MKIEKTLLWFLSICLSFSGILSFNILAIFPYHGKSHFFAFEPYLKELARRGHNLTVISYFPQQKPLQNYHDISLADKMEILEGVVSLDTSYWSIIQMVFFITKMGRETCKVLLEDKNVQILWKTEAKFDLVVTEQFNSDCSLGLAYKLGAPVVGMTSHTLMPWHYDRFGIQYSPSHMLFHFLGGGSSPTLYQRIERTIFHNFIKLVYKYSCQMMNQYELQQYFDVPPLENLASDIKILIAYTTSVLNGKNLLPPNVIEVGGYHVAKPKELPQELKKFIEESDHGVIYISFGSMVQSTSAPEDKVQAIVAAISELPQRVVWKWDSKTLPGNPKNVFVSNWLPQNDILAHPNVLAFYSHCGLLGITEAIYHGVPVVGMPVFGDQPGNAGAVVESGLGVEIQYEDLTKENLLQKLMTVLNPEFRKKVKELSRTWRDRPMSAMDAAIYWTEYAARHKNYTFRTPAASVPLYQFLYLDVILVLGAILFAPIYALKFILSLFKTKPQPKKLKTK